MTAPPKPCERCGENPRLDKQRYCNTCRIAVLRELKEAGYLQRIPWNTPRSGDQKQDRDSEGSESRFDK